MEKKTIILNESVFRKIMKQLVFEVKNDNLHQFIDYIASFGKNGNLNTSVNNILELANEAEISQMTISNLYDDLDFDDYSDNEEDIERIKYNLVHDICENLTLNERGLIFVERNVMLPYFSNNESLLEKLKRDFDGHLGEYWSYIRGLVVDATYNGNEVSFKGYVRPEDVDWGRTISANIMCPDEYELTLEYDSDIEIHKITAVTKNKNEYTIWNKPTILKV